MLSAKWQPFLSKGEKLTHCVEEFLMGFSYYVQAVLLVSSVLFCHEWSMGIFIWVF